MTKAELISRVYGKKNLPHGLTRKTVMQIVDSVFTEMGDYFIRAKATRVSPAKLTYPGFGTFSKRRRTGRIVKNPQDGSPVTIPARFTVTFSPGSELKSLLNRAARPKTVAAGK
jgi:nucleoid DNA-binding protein